ncbi:hypothetical protein CYMTET_56256 [Cymbomonas tetramitiformis]|uniref:Uncharacterized protein n=1 Tax=Cymbomonas tetramitiformis TaxID=36881 RepID=A0AAE0EM51_9CHLO|nr:hypothetical protein CYMTET_56256 [Cymbomonas tetramitiformis]
MAFVNGFKEIFDYIFVGGYTPPCYQLVVQQILHMSHEHKTKLTKSILELLEEGILPSIAGDIWSQGGIAIFGILVYWLDQDFTYHEKLLAALPFSDVRHTAGTMESATKEACADIGLGEYNFADNKDDVASEIHSTVSDNASNIVSGWMCFDGHECTDHTIALMVKTFLEQPGVKKVAVQTYDVESPSKAANAVNNPDGSVYRSHQLDSDQWNIVRECMYVLQYAKQACDILQGTKCLTVNLVLLYLCWAGKLTREKAFDWITKAWDSDWKPKPVATEGEGAKSPHQSTKRRRKGVVTIADFMQDFMRGFDDEDEGEVS